MSTSVEGLSAKPIIDILVGLDDVGDLEKTIDPLLKHVYIYFEVYNEFMPYRRLFTKHKATAALELPNIIKSENDVPKSTYEHSQRLTHVHILLYNSEHWVRHIAFRNYLRSHPEIKNEYQLLKESLASKDWLDGNEYSKAKDSFIKAEEQKAVAWYNAGENH